MAPTHGGEVGGEGGGGGDAGPSSVGPSGEGGSDLSGSFGATPLMEEEYTPPFAQSHTGAGSSAFDATHFYQ